MTAGVSELLDTLSLVLNTPVPGADAHRAGDAGLEPGPGPGERQGASVTV